MTLLYLGTVNPYLLVRRQVNALLGRHNPLRVTNQSATLSLSLGH